MTKFVSFLAGIQFSLIVFSVYMIHRIRKYDEGRQAITNMTAEIMKARGHGGFGLAHDAHMKFANIMNDPQAHELKMACEACEETWFPSSREEMAPCPKCGSMSVTGSA